MTGLSTALFTKRKPGPDAQPTQHPPVHPELQQLQTTIKIVLCIICTVFFLAIGLPWPAVVALAMGFYSLRTPSRRR